MRHNCFTNKYNFKPSQTKMFPGLLKDHLLLFAHMKIQNSIHGSEGRFFIEENGEQLAEMTYTMRKKNTLVINHTEVSEQLRGKNIGFELVTAGVDFARSEGLKILPYCSFAGKVLKNEPLFADVLVSAH